MYTPLLRRIALMGATAVFALIASGCAYLGTEDDPAADPTVPGSVEGTATPNDSSNSTAGIGEDVSATTVDVPTTPAPTTTTTTSTTTTVPPTTTIPPPLGVDELILTPSALGQAQMGADPDQVVSYLSAILGAPTNDTGWVTPESFVACEGTTVRRVEWGALGVMFGDESDVTSGRTHLMSYSYGLVGQLDAEPQGLLTAEGIGLGSSVDQLLTAYPTATIDEGDPAVDIPPSFYVSDSWRGLLSGPDSDDFVLVVLAGPGCEG